MLRIFPPMYLTLAIGASLCFAGLIPGIPTWRGVLFEATHLSNYFLIAGNQQELVLGQRVFWSLAVEEHFYLFFPVIALWLLRTLPMRRVVYVLIAAVVIVLMWRTVLLLHFDATELWLQHASDTRVDSILYGAIMAFGFNPVLDRPLLENPKRAALVLVAALVGLVLTAAPRSVLFRETMRYSLQGLLLMPIYYVLVSRPRWPVVRWLNWGVIRYLGTISYSLYLVHDTVLQTLHISRPTWGWPLLVVFHDGYFDRLRGRYSAIGRKAAAVLEASTESRARSIGGLLLEHCPFRDAPAVRSSGRLRRPWLE